MNGTYIDVPLQEGQGADAWTLGDFSQTNIAYVDGLLGRTPTVQDMVAEGFSAAAAATRARETAIDVGNQVDEDGHWASLTAFANNLSEQYAYRLIDFVVFGPTVDSNSYVSSILRWAADAGLPINNFQTDPFTPGSETWLGLASDDLMDANITFAGITDVHHLFGGLGRDTLIGNADDNYLVGGNDADVDVLDGGLGNDTLIGRYNQNNIGASDRFLGGAGDDHLIVVDPERVLAGGLPDTDMGFSGSSSGFTHNGSQGVGTGIKGGAGSDTLDFSQIDGPMSFRVADDALSSIEYIEGSQFSDTFHFVGALLPGVMTINGSSDSLDQYTDTANFSQVSEQGGLNFLFLNSVIDGNGLFQVTTIDDSSSAVVLSDVDNVIGSEFDDYFLMQNNSNSYSLIDAGGGVDTLDLSLVGDFGGGSGALVDLAIGTFRNVNDRESKIQNFQNIAGSELDDTIACDDDDNVIFGGGGHDQISGSEGDDISFGGEGNDNLEGGSGNDTIIFENDDTSVVGGADIDVAHFFRTDASDTMMWDARSASFSAEAVLGCENDDTFYASDTDSSILAGGAGDDTFHIS